MTNSAMLSGGRRRRSAKAQNRGQHGVVWPLARHGDLRCSGVCLGDAATVNDRRFCEFILGGEHAQPAMGSGLAWQQRWQDAGPA
jgi:hypothetical protein